MFQAYRLPGLLLAIVTLAAAGTPRTKAEVESIILHSRHLGADGLDYNERSLMELLENIDPPPEACGPYCLF